MKEQFTLPVYSTEDYSIFKKLKGNRDLYKNHAQKLVKIIEKEPGFTKKNPIKVNEKMEIIDGQHRLAAFEEFSKREGKILPIYYVILKGATLADARAMNAGSKAWIPRDYALAFANDGNKNYQIYLDFVKKYPIQHNILLIALTGEGNEQRRVFRDGGLVVGDLKNARKELEMLGEIGPMYINWPVLSFGSALISLLRHRMYDHDRMVRQMKLYADALNSVPARQKDLRVALNMVYNFKTKEKLDLLKNN